MTWFDGLIALIAAGCLVWAVRMEAGRGLFDAVATLVAVIGARQFAPLMAQLLGHHGALTQEPSGGALVLAFLPLWIGAMTVSWFLHQRTRWSMDSYNIVFTTAFGLIMAIGLGHFTADVATRLAVEQYGHEPEFLRASACADELRTFHTYHYVLQTIQSASSTPR